MTTRREPRIRQYPGGLFSQNGYLVSCPETGAALLIDPGASVSQMLSAAAEEALEIQAIVLTHAHIDHVEGVSEAKASTGAPILVHADDIQLYRQAPLQAQWFGMQLADLPPHDGLLEEGRPVRFGSCAFDVFHTPGHSPGHVIFVTPGHAIVGDCVFAGSIGRTDLPGGDMPTLMASIRRSILTLPDDTILYSGHGAQTTVGHERVANPFLAPQFGGSRFA